MKKLLLSAICISTFLASTTVSRATSESLTISTETHSNYHVFTEEELNNTPFEGKDVAYFDGTAYVNGANLKGIAVHIAGVLIGYIIDGALICVTGHSPSELSAYALQSFFKAISNIGEEVVSAYFPTGNSPVSSVRTKSERDCVAAPGGMWKCTMTEFWNE